MAKDKDKDTTEEAAPSVAVNAPVEREATPLMQAAQAVETIRSYGDVRGWRVNLSPEVAETLAQAEEYAKNHPTSAGSTSTQATLAAIAADMDKREAAFLKGHQAQQAEIAALVEEQDKAAAKAAAQAAKKAAG
jgi:hypothetical protein